jgi:KUP system potassium uptake protein
MSEERAAGSERGPDAPGDGQGETGDPLEPEAPASSGGHGGEARDAPCERKRRRLAGLTLAALGVVYGDIGTSPLYALRECFHGAYGIEPTRGNVLGVLSLVLWSLVFVISLKYLALILRAENRGEGGILVLMALALAGRSRAERGRRRGTVIALGLFGAALLYGDGMITPAISVLGAVEGLEVATSRLQRYVVPITVAVLAGVFLFQRRGTARIGAVYGPVTLVWFLALAALGARAILRHPAALAAASPHHALEFFARNQGHGFLVLGAVFLVVTGGEALYADMGHFGRRPIRLAWFAVVLPALLVNYFGQGALLLADPAAAHNPFYRLAPDWALYPLVALATAATVIASQAVISGAFSLTRQAILLGYSPRMPIDHTSEEEIGQIYIAPVNWMLFAATLGLVLAFRSSSALAGAYGMAVSATMVITTLLFYVVARRIWGWSRLAAAATCASFLAIDLAFFGANLAKLADGGWFPLAVAALVYTLMSTWKRGRQILAARQRQALFPIEDFLADLGSKAELQRVGGTAVFMTGNPEGTPPALLHNVKHNHVVHERVILLTVVTEDVARVPDEERLEVQAIGQGFHRIVARYGFMQSPNVPAILRLAERHGLAFDLMETSFFLAREHLLATAKPGMALWREKFFAFMSRNAQGATAFLRIPPGRVVELGSQVEL